MRKLLSIILAISVVFTSFAAFAAYDISTINESAAQEPAIVEDELAADENEIAQEPVLEEVIEEEPVMNSLTVTFNVNDVDYVKRKAVKVVLYRASDDMYLSDATFFIESDNESYTVNLPAGEVKEGNQYKLTIDENIHSIITDDGTFIYGGGYAICTASHDGDNAFSFKTNAYTEEPIEIYINGLYKPTSVPSRTYGTSVFAELSELLRVCGIPQESAMYLGKKIRIAYDGKTLDFDYATSQELLDSAASKAQIIDGMTYVPVKTFGRTFAKSVDIKDTGINYEAHITIESKNDAEKRVSNISSKTDYLIWINKAKFELNVFLGKKGDWDLIKTFPCTIGKPSTPTITGEYEYQWKESRWPYANYYVGPIMRFYRGYAIHTVLLNYDGTEYDGRVGQMLSLGCIRLKKADMEWLISMAPLYTKIYITEN